ncbi:hypothetical protein SESBI_50808 [Sesbania bispinosa]|nr:hypothetical protein SESBI_50808 [Sesbania bispinosa]
MVVRGILSIRLIILVEREEVSTRMMEGLNQGRLPIRPPQITTTSRGEVKGLDLNKWCDYHRAKGHDTENIWTLRHKIEHLIKEGFLGRYVREDDQIEDS